MSGTFLDFFFDLFSPLQSSSSQQQADSGRVEKQDDISDKDKMPVPFTGGSSVAVSRPPKVWQATNGNELTFALKEAISGDAIVITESGNYGAIVVRGKNNIRIKSSGWHIQIQGHIILDAGSEHIKLEHLNLYAPEGMSIYRPLIIADKSTRNIDVQFCLLSSEKVTPNNFQSQFMGNPETWVSGIRLLGRNNLIQHNKLVNLRIAIMGEGEATDICHNQIQFFAEDGIRAQNHRIKVIQNSIFEGITDDNAEEGHRDAIQLIPPSHAQNLGRLDKVEIRENTIKSHHHNTRTPANRIAILQGIFGSDGYFINTVIKDNRIVVNSDHGITLNGANNLVISGNQIASVAVDGRRPGIKLYFSRIGGGANHWQSALPYSVLHTDNAAPVFNVPRCYREIDNGGNLYADMTHHDTRSISHRSHVGFCAVA
jgi:hypothetical protein